MYEFRDPIHGFIKVSDLELKIIDSKPFQRLRNIRQLATTYLVYHGAEHTRFGHSLGVMELVSRAFNSAVDNYNKSNEEEIFTPIDRAWYQQILRLIALTHDLGHAPFSHASEALFDEGLEHEDFTKMIMCETEVAQYIRDIGEDFKRKHNVGDEYDITPELLWLIYGEKNPELNDAYTMPDYKFLKSFMDSDIDCDKMDYLLRDSYYCGVNYGKYDLNRLLSSLNIYRNKEENIMQLAVEKGGINVFEEFVIARYFMFIQVYFHKTRRYFDYLLVENIKSVLTDSIYPNDVIQYLSLDDNVIIERIKQRAADGDKQAIKFINREPMSCVFDTQVHMTNADKRLFNVIKRALLQKIDKDDIIDDEANKVSHKIPVISDSQSSKGIPIIATYSKQPESLSQSLLLKSLIDPINIKRLYVSKEFYSIARREIEEALSDDS